MKENGIWRYIRPKLLPFTSFLERIDAKAIPDVHLILKSGEESWIELKILKKLPTRASTDLGLDMDQGTWMYKYCKAGGNGNILCYIESDKYYMMFDGILAHTIAQKVDKDFLFKNAKLIEKKNVNEIVEVIRNG